MLAPAPHTHGLQRAYRSNHQAGFPTTSRKNVDKENALALPSKTPSRAGPSGAPLKMGMGAPDTVMRTGLGLKTNQRNQLKQSTSDDIEPKRLFQAPGKTLPPSKSLASMPMVSRAKTPAPARTVAPSVSRTNLRTPAPSRTVQVEPMPVPLPSAQRTRRRSRQSVLSTPDASNTPAGHWEEEASLDSISEGVAGLGLGAAVAEEPELEDESDLEVEYMPPKMELPPWRPAWDEPDILPALDSWRSRPPLWEPMEDVPIADAFADFVPKELPHDTLGAREGGAQSGSPLTADDLLKLDDRSPPRKPSSSRPRTGLAPVRANGLAKNPVPPAASARRVPTTMFAAKPTVRPAAAAQAPPVAVKLTARPAVPRPASASAASTATAAPRRNMPAAPPRAPVATVPGSRPASASTSLRGPAAKPQ